MADIVELARRFTEAGDDHRSRSSFYARLNREIARRPEIVSLLQAAPAEQQLPVLLLAAVHSIVLSEPDVELAAWYPTTAAEPLRSDPFPAFERLCAARRDDLIATIASRSVQTNEVGRCALLLPGVAAISEDVGPVSLIDVGASAGLNLQLDRYRYAYDPGGRIGAMSPVVVECATRGDALVPTVMPTVASRVGVDRHPIDVTEPAEAQWLAACVWPDQPDRFHRLRAAILLAQQAPSAMIRGDAVDAVPDAVRAAAGTGHPIVLNSWVLNYLSEAHQRAYVDALDDLGREIDMSWVYAESPGLCPGVPFPPELRDDHITVVMTTLWRCGQRTSVPLGTAHPHGYWWHAPGS